MARFLMSIDFKGDNIMERIAKIEKLTHEIQNEIRELRKAEVEATQIEETTASE